MTESPNFSPGFSDTLSMGEPGSRMLGHDVVTGADGAPTGALTAMRRSWLVVGISRLTVVAASGLT